MTADARLDDFAELARGIYLEGLAIDHERGLVWFSDVVGGGIHAVRSDGTPVATLNPDRMWTGGVLVNKGGIVLSSGQGGIAWTNPETGAAGWLIDRIDGAPINGINEMVPDGQGGLYFGTVDLDSVIAGRAPGPTCLYRLDRDRTLTRIADGVGFSNGLMLDAQARRLYCNDTFRGTWAFDLGADGVPADRRLILAKEDADGLALDALGCLWITGFRSGVFTRLAADGTRLADVPTPGEAITQLRFGGADGRDCYFHVVPIDGGEALKNGTELSARRSILYHARSTVPGRPVAPTEFRLG
ncbi:SMP-30/gluconolactonase/LRE family protein [Novosphingobium aerophilum]|uniref:SMP-30/gluconolactonase/LRE family protein n=1 Tax=Novosphingobium aerophilum TaxID=2839843 RepID=A0A7X1F522_9SPHN|nr:SMP-30/gluconolactonase/LRE family protein [Novosphingobium aerophilum]MBC2650468.1 SMP-30/gluconolactonase/LRE family protein [Novosphingobium aerophilum]